MFTLADMLKPTETTIYFGFTRNAKQNERFIEIKSIFTSIFHYHSVQLNSFKVQGYSSVWPYPALFF